MRRIATTAAAIVALLAGLALVAACSSDDGDAGDSTTSTTLGNESRVIGPTILDADETSATVSVGTMVSFDLGDPDPGRFEATSSDPEVFRVESDGGSQGTFSTNAGGIAISPGTAEVEVVHVDADGEGDDGDTTTFTITVE